MPWNGIERRKENRMPDRFQPQTAFEGFVAAKLENMEKQLDTLPCGESFKRIGKCETRIANIEGRTTIFGMIAGFVAGIIAKIFLK